MKKRIRKHHFSCVELCLIATLFILGGALLFPVLSQAQTAGKEISCLNNLRSCIRATAAYANEYDGIAMLKYGDSSTGKLLMSMAHGTGVGDTRIKTARRLSVKDIICPETTVLPKRVTWHFAEFYAVPYALFNDNYSLTPYE